ncbi:hypothetical protein ACLOJK_007406 [Asimina triloba]
MGWHLQLVVLGGVVVVAFLDLLLNGVLELFALLFREELFLGREERIVGGEASWGRLAVLFPIRVSMFTALGTSIPMTVVGLILGELIDSDALDECGHVCELLETGDGALSEEGKPHFLLHIEGGKEGSALESFESSAEIHVDVVVDHMLHLKVEGYGATSIWRSNHRREVGLGGEWWDKRDRSHIQ